VSAPPAWAPRRDLPALGFALAFPAVMTWLYLVALATQGQSPGEASPAVRLAFGLGKVVQFGFPLLYIGYFERDRLRPAAPTARGLALGLGFGLLVSLAMLGAYFGFLRHTAMFAQTPTKVFRLLEDMGFATPARFLLLAVFYSVGHSLLEEYYWRWFVFDRLRRYTPLGGAIALSAAGFTAHHVVLLAVYFPGRFWALALPLSACVAVGGAVWAWIYHRAESLYAPWLSHGLIDAAIMAIGYAMLVPFWQG
jgi:membrane protease YdiL (CAAX protease family)